MPAWQPGRVLHGLFIMGGKKNANHTITGRKAKY